MYKKINPAILFLLFFIFPPTVDFLYSQPVITAEVSTFSSKIFYSGENPLIKKEIDEIIKRNVNFKVQTIFTIGFPLDFESKNGISILDSVINILTDIESYNYIPFSKKNNSTGSLLFKDVTIFKDYTNENGIRFIEAEQTISPFRPTKMLFSFVQQDDFILFKVINTEPIRFWIFPILWEEKMITIFTAHLKKTETGNILECYGLGVADTGTSFLFGKKAREEFNNSTETLISWLYNLILTSAKHSEVVP